MTNSSADRDNNRENNLGVALVTGGSRGIGAGICERLAADGWDVAVAATTEQNAATVAADLADRHGVATLAVGMVVQDYQSVVDGCARAEAELGPLGLVVNNAGVSGVAPVLEMDPADFSELIDINVKGVFHGSKAGLAAMMASGTKGSIIQIGSVAGVNGFPQRVGYCSSKAAVHMITKVLGAEMAEHGIRVNAVAPGYIGTDLIQELMDDGRLDPEPVLARIPMGEMGAPVDIAAAVSWLASNESRYVTGETIFVDGGWTAYGHV